MKIEREDNFMLRAENEQFHASYSSVSERVYINVNEKDRFRGPLLMASLSIEGSEIQSLIEVLTELQEAISEAKK